MANRGLRIGCYKKFMKFKLATLWILSALVFAGCHHHHHIPPVAVYPPVTLDTENQIGGFHSLLYSQGGKDSPKSLRQTLDLYVPLKGKQPYPVVVWVHGGSWMYGDKSEVCPGSPLLGAKYAIASINYRLDTESSFPAQIYDLKAAVRFLRAHAQQYHLDPDRIAVWGSSAGGHLAALLGTSGNVKALEGSLGYGAFSSRVQAVVDWCGPTDFNTADSQAPAYCKIKFHGQTSPVYVLMGGRMDKNSLASASPVTYVSKDDPPFLLMHGDLDDAIPPGQSKQLHKALLSSGVSSEYHHLPGYGHSFSAPEHLQMVQKFLDDKLRDRKPLD